MKEKFINILKKLWKSFSDSRVDYQRIEQRRAEMIEKCSKYNHPFL